MKLLQCITKIFHLSVAPGPSSIFYGTENLWMKTQLLLPGAKYVLRLLYVPTYRFLHGGYCHYIIEYRTLNWAWETSFLCQLSYMPLTLNTICSLFVSHVFNNNKKRKNSPFLWSFLPPNMKNSIKLFFGSPTCLFIWCLLPLPGIWTNKRELLGFSTNHDSMKLFTDFYNKHHFQVVAYLTSFQDSLMIVAICLISTVHIHGKVRFYIMNKNWSLSELGFNLWKFFKANLSFLICIPTIWFARKK